MMIMITLVVLLLQANDLFEFTSSLSRKEQFIIASSRDSASDVFMYVPELPISYVSLHFDLLGLTLSIVREILLIIF